MSQKNKGTIFSITSKANPFRVYYSIRDRVYFEMNNLVNNRAIYWINAFSYLLLISMISTKNLKIIIKVIKDGYKGNLGKREI